MSCSRIPNVIPQSVIDGLAPLLAPPRQGGTARLQELEIDLSKNISAASGEGHEVMASGRYLAVRRVPPNVNMRVQFDGMSARHSIRGGDVFHFGDDTGSRKLRFFWDEMEPVGVPVDDDMREDLRVALLTVSDEIAAFPPIERVFVVACPAHGFYVGQGKITVTGTAVQLAIFDAEEIRLTAHPSNVGPLLVGDSGVNNTADGTGNGEFLNPGSALTYPLDASGRLYLNGTANDRWSYFIPYRRR